MLKLQPHKRRSTGGIVTAVLSCGLLADWIEVYRGESIELVYIFALRLHRSLQEMGTRVGAFGYDNACKLLSLARVVAGECKPWSESFVHLPKFVLDRFHRDNHTWCLNNMPEVDPLAPCNADLLESQNTEACEELNSWISGRTSSVLEMTRGHFEVYWWTMFKEHNDWLCQQAECKRRRYARGGLARDPDKARASSSV